MKLQGKRETFLSAYKKLFSIFLPAVFYLSLVPSSFLFSQEPVSEIMPEPLYVPVQVNVRDGKTFRRDMVYAVIDEKFELQSYSGSRLIGLFTGLVEIQHLSSLEGVEWVTPSMLEEAGMVVSYDPSRIVSEIYIPPAIQPVRDISLRGEKKASNLPRVEPAGFSGALPFYVTFYHTKSSLDVPEEFRDRSEYGLNLFP